MWPTGVGEALAQWAHRTGLGAVPLGVKPATFDAYCGEMFAPSARVRAAIALAGGPAEADWDPLMQALERGLGEEDA